MSGREATINIIPGDYAISVGRADLPAPRGWRWVELTDVARLESGHTPSRYHSDYWDGGIPWIGIKDARTHHGAVIDQTFQTVTQAGIDNSAARMLPPGTVCLSRTASVGYVVVMGREMATSQDFVNWVCGPELDPHFLKQLLIAENESLFRFGKGSTHTTIYYPEVKAFHICLPPLQEQKRIVAKLETLQSHSRRAREALDAVPPLLEKLRQSILAAAFRGDLTKDWRAKHPEVEPASELLKRIRIERRKKWEDAELAKMKSKGKAPTDDKWKAKYKEPEPVDATGLPKLPEGWCWTNVDAVLTGSEDLFDGPFGSALKTSDYQQTGVRVVRLENLANLEFRAERKTYISSAKFDSLTRHAVHAGDIIFGSFVEEATRVCVLPDLGGPAIAKADCFCVRPDSRILPAELLVLALSTRHARLELTRGIHGATRPRINTGQLRSLRVPLPPFSEQGVLRDRVDAALSAVRRLSSGHDDLLANFAALDRGVLAKAFRGELVPQDPDDEPAEVNRDANGAGPKAQKKARKARGEART